tara:strand:+ start:2941 stop:4137 length:1197 start_codon:yes stop_codon:yes gene_type:complete
MLARNLFKRGYKSITFNNTAKAYKLLNDDKLKQQRDLYKLFNVLSENESIGHSMITNFMNVRPPFIYPRVQNILFNQFCGGESLDELTPLIKNILNNDVTPMLNYGVEYSTDEEALQNCTEEMISMINYLKKNKKGYLKGQSILRVTGIMSHQRIEKMQNNVTLTKKEGDLWKRDMERLNRVCEYAVSNKIKLLFDAETDNIQHMIHQLSLQMMKRFNGNMPRIYGTIQFYRKDSHKQLDKLIEDGIMNNYTPGLKLVRGAYIHDETIANRRNIIHDTKDETDESYNTAVTKCIYNLDKIAVCFAGHNTTTVKHIIDTLDKKNIKPMHPHIMLAQMYGMRNDITFNLDKVNVSQFIPYGNKDFLFPYLVRRGIENSSALGGSKEEVILLGNEIKRREI